MPIALKSKDALVADYVKGWTGYRLDGKGFIVPDVKRGEIPRLSTRSAVIGETKAYDPKSKLFIAGIANAKEIDRMNEVMEPTGVLLDSFNKNPILLLGHCHGDPIGQVSSLKAEENGLPFEAWVGDPAAGAILTRAQEDARSLVAQKILKAVSVGFIAHKIRYPTYNERNEMVDPAVIEQWEMLELSIVAVPCNASALFEAAGTSPGKAAPSWNFPTLGADGRLVVAARKLWAFPTLGANGRLIVKQPPEA